MHDPTQPGQVESLEHHLAPLPARARQASAHLHVVEPRSPAHLLKADEFITTEKPGKAIYKNTLVPVLYLSK
jgi:hypothetical protein